MYPWPRILVLSLDTLPTIAPYGKKNIIMPFLFCIFCPDVIMQINSAFFQFETVQSWTFQKKIGLCFWPCASIQIYLIHGLKLGINVTMRKWNSTNFETLMTTTRSGFVFTNHSWEYSKSWAWKTNFRWWIFLNLMQYQSIVLHSLHN